MSALVDRPPCALSASLLRPRNKRMRSCGSMVTVAGGRVLVLGGTGFVGSAVCEKALRAGFSVVSVSRRGKPVDGPQGVDWRTGDAKDPSVARSILAEGGFTAVRI